MKNISVSKLARTVSEFIVNSANQQGQSHDFAEVLEIALAEIGNLPSNNRTFTEALHRVSGVLRIKELATWVATKASLKRFGTVDRESEAYEEIYSMSYFVIIEMLVDHPEWSDAGIRNVAYERVRSYLAYKWEVANKTKYFVEKEQAALADAGEPERNVYLQQHRPGWVDEDGQEQDFSPDKYFVDEGGHEFEVDALCESDFERETVRLLTDSPRTRVEIIDELGCKEHELKSTIRKLKSRDVDFTPRSLEPGRKQSKRELPTASPRHLRKVTPLKHDSDHENAGCPLRRLKAYCCEGPLDELLVDLYRRGLRYDEIAEQAGVDERYAKRRLSEIAFRCLRM